MGFSFLSFFSFYSSSSSPIYSSFFFFFFFFFFLKIQTHRKWTIKIRAGQQQQKKELHSCIENV
jgi:flagellar biosynthesis protein FliR